MALKLTLTVASSGDATVDVEIDAPADITIGALATELAARSPHHDVHAVTLALRRGPSGNDPIDPTAALHETGIISGCVVDLVTPDAGYVAPAPDSAPAVAVITNGPGVGTRLPLRRGSNVVGRDPSCDVVLADEMVSRRHVRIDIGDPIEVIDLGSVNGTIVAGAHVPRARLDPTTDILIGDTTLRIEVRGDIAGTQSGGFVRSPPTTTVVSAEEVVAPSVPTAAKPSRLPVIAALAPVLLGAVMFALTRRVESLIFIALSPVMLIGSAVESRVSNRRGSKRSAATFREELADFAADGHRRLAAEAAARRDEQPDLRTLIEALHSRTPTLWSRRPDSEHFAELCVGRGRQPARTTFVARKVEGAQRELADELTETLAMLALVDDVPISVDLTVDGSVGLAGPPGQARSVAASMVASTVLMHSPAELVVTLLSSEGAAPEWDWLKWLPHVDDVHSPIDGRLLASTAGACGAVHAALMQLRDARAAASRHQSGTRHLPTMLVVIEDDAPIERSLVVELLEAGPDVGIYTIWVAAGVDRLPAGCRAVVDVSGGVRGMSLRIRRTKEVAERISADLLDLGQLDELARAVSPIVDTGARTRDDSGLPDVVLGPELLGLQPDAPPETILERWAHTSIETARHHDTGLRAPVGVAGGEPFVLDLRAHGPHALVGGTTGAGKSEFLQSWVMGLATSYSPQRVNFLFVDYKGGSAFRECVKLPHCVGLVTDLSPHLVDRALTSLHAELIRREHLFGSLDAKDIHELERRGAADTPPVLIIVVDEFAALAQEVPQFVDGVVNVAQRGRSLGLHLVLATQRPAGVITGNLRANTNIRVALRMADESDSSDVIDASDAAFIDSAQPGRGFAKVGPGRTHPFQSAFYGGWSTQSSVEQQLTVRPLHVGDQEPWPAARANRAALDEPNDLAKLVAATQRAALIGDVPSPRRPWLPELGGNLDLREAVLTRSDAEIVFGTCDIPTEQVQPSIAFFPDRDGNLAVFGASGSGKSTLLRTIAMVAGSSTAHSGGSDGSCHVYCIDFGSRSLQLLEDFAHVGSVVNADDHERIVRLLRQIRTTIDERQLRFRAADADTLSQYRQHSGDVSVPRVLLAIDNFGAFRQAYDAPDRAATLDLLVSIMADGRSAGVHVILSADRPGAVSSAITSMIPRRLVLRLANESDFMLLGEPANVLGSDTPPGRGIEGGREFQVAVLGGTANLADQTRLARALARHDGFVGANTPAPPVRRLPELVELNELPVAVSDRPVLGLDDATLLPVGFEPAGAFLVAGPPGSGRTTALAAMAVSLGRARPEFQRVLLAERRSSLVGITSWTTVADRPREHAELATAILADLAHSDGEFAGLAIFIENATELLEAPEAEAPVLELIKVALTHDAFVVVEGEISQLARAWKLDAVKNQRTGLLLQPQTPDGDVLKANFPRIGRDEFPVGRALLVERRQLSKVQMPLIGPA